MKKYVLAAVLVLYGAVVCLAIGIPDMKFRRLDTRDGLANSQVNCMIRDSHGFMWLATPFGLCRYDGYRFRNFYSYERDTTTLRSNRVDEVQEDFYGRLWLDHGMNYSVLDPLTEKVDRSPAVWLAEQGMPGGLEYIYIDSEKKYWVKSYDNGFYCYDPRSKHVTKIPFGYEVGSFPKDFAITSCAENGDGTLLLVSNTGQLLCVDGKAGAVKWKDDYVQKAQNSSFSDYRLYRDKPNDMTWIICNTSALYVCKNKEKRWFHTLADFMRAKGFQNVPDDIVVWDVAYDGKGYFWVATDHIGALVFDFKTKTWRQFLNVKNDDSSLPESTLRHFYLDQMGRMWVSTYKSGVAMNADALANFNNLPLGDINTITQDRQGYFWLGMNSGGIMKLNPNTYEVVDSFKKAQLGVKSDVIVGSYAAKDGTLWFGTWEGGLIKYRNGEWSNITASTPGSKFVTNNIWAITEDYWGNIWVAVLGGGVVRIDKKTGAQRAFTDKNSYLATVWTNSITRAANGWILAGNSEYCALINPLNFRVINMPAPRNENTFTISRATTQVIMDSRNLIWQASPSGLSIADRTNGRSYLLDMKSGFYGSNVSSVVEDDNHTIWAVTDHGVSNVIPQQDDEGNWTFTVRSYNDRDGLQPGPFNQRSIYYSHSGLVLVGGLDGLDIINTKKLTANKLKEKPVFCGLKIYDDLIEAGQEYNGRVVLEKTLSQSEGFKLKYSEGQFTVEMGSDNCGIKNGTGFVYRLLGFSDKWIKLSPSNPNITYMGLSPGSYTLCVRMLNDDGTIGEEESELDITIAPPFYRSWWAYLLYLCLIIAGIWWWRKNFIRRQDIQMEAESFRRETEKEQWMNEMRRRMSEEQQDTTVKPMTKEDIELYKTEGDIVEFVRLQTEALPKPANKRFNIAFNATVEALHMHYDPNQLGQALQILMSNSVHFCPHECNLQVSLFVPSGKEVKILVADNGVGIKEEFIDHVFEHVMVGDRELGLDRVRAIVEAHGGSIKVENNPGGGTVFTLTLPRE